MNVVAVVGPTASGKSSLAMGLARRTGGEIVSVDSMQVYRGMDIGTAKPTPADQEAVRHHLIDLIDATDMYSVSEFQTAGRVALREIAARRHIAIICGGSGLHFRALVDPMEFPPTDQAVRTEVESLSHEAALEELLVADSNAAQWVDLANPRRVRRAVEIHRLTGAAPSERAGSAVAVDVRDYRPLVPFYAIGVDAGEGLARRVEHRLDRMLERGWLEEAETMAPQLGSTAALAVGYRELAEVAGGRLDLPAARESILQTTMALAKRQRTFFRRDPRIRWIAWHDDPDQRLRAGVAALEEAGAWTS